MSFPFPQLLAFLEDEKDQVDFMKIAAEVGLGSGDIEIAKLLLALQLYKAFYATIPREIKSVHDNAIGEFQRLRDEVEFLANQAGSDAIKIGNWAEEIQRTLKATRPEALANILHKRLMEETLTAMSGSVRALTSAHGHIETATQAMHQAGYQAAVAIDAWQAMSLRRVWANALLVSFVLALLVVSSAWLLFLRH